MNKLSFLLIGIIILIFVQRKESFKNNISDINIRIKVRKDEGKKDSKGNDIPNKYEAPDGAYQPPPSLYKPWTSQLNTQQLRTWNNYTYGEHPDTGIQYGS